MGLFGKKKVVKKEEPNRKSLFGELLQVEVTRSGMLTLFLRGGWLMFSPEDTKYIQKNLNEQLKQKKK